MKHLNPLFTNQNSKKNNVNQGANIRKKTITKKEGRKERCDRKKDVKIPFNEDERKLIKHLARQNNLDPTPYCTLLIKKALKGNYVFPECLYNPKGKPYPAKLESYYFDLLFDYKIEWDCSLKESAYRIISFMIKDQRRAML